MLPPTGAKKFSGTPAFGGTPAEIDNSLFLVSRAGAGPSGGYASEKLTGSDLLQRAAVFVSGNFVGYDAYDIRVAATEDRLDALEAGTTLTPDQVDAIAGASSPSAANVFATADDVGLRLLATDNLSDLDNAATARTNLGVAYGTTAGTVVEGNDARLSDARDTTWAFVKAKLVGTIAAAAGAFNTSTDTLEVWLGKLRTMVEANATAIANAQKYLPFTTVTAAYTLQAADFGTVVRVNSATAVTITVPAGLGTGIGEHIEVRQVGAGAVTLAFASGVTANAYPSGATKTAGQHASAFLHCAAANTWNLANAVL